MSSPELSDARIRATGAAVLATFGLFAAFLYFSGGANLLVAAFTDRPATLVVDNEAGRLLLASFGFAAAALPFFVPPFAPRYFMRRPRPAPARLAIVVIFVGVVAIAAGLLAGGAFQALYLQTLGYRMCGASRAGASLFLMYETWAQPRQDCPAAEPSRPIP